MKTVPLAHSSNRADVLAHSTAQACCTAPIKKPVKIPAGQFFFWKTDIGAKHRSRANAEPSDQVLVTRAGLVRLECSLDKSTKGRV